MWSKLPLVLGILVTAIAASAAKQPASKPMTAEQLQLLLLSAQSEHATDDATLRQLEDVKLTARMSSDTLDKIVATSPGPRTTLALRALSDLSSFLDPPSNEIPQAPAPDADTQKKMLADALHYVARTLPALPNFLASRATGHFNDTPMMLSDGGAVVREELHLIGKSTSSITFRDGRESDGPTRRVALDTSKLGQSALSLEDASRSWVSTDVIPNHESTGLETHGEFGPIMGIVLLDSAKGKISWAHWETDGSRQLAVFHFTVDRAVSHYSVAYCCVNDQGAHLITGYHGTLIVDPATGTILRIVVQANLRPDDPMTRSEMMVEYGPVSIGDNKYICPIRSVSISTPNPNWNGQTPADKTNQARLLLNDVQYVDYHRFGSESKLVDTPVSEAAKP